MKSRAKAKQSERASEHTVSYGANAPRFSGKRIFRTQADRDRLGKPDLPPEDEWVAELEAAAKKKRVR